MYSVQAERAVRKTARFADPRPFCIVTRGTGLPRIPVGRFFAVLLAPGGGLAVFVLRPGQAAGSARAISSRPHGGDDRVRVAATGMEGQHGAVAIGAVPGYGRRGEPRRQAARVPGVPGPTRKLGACGSPPTYAQAVTARSSAICRKPAALPGDGLVMVSLSWLVVTGSKVMVVGWFDPVARVILRLCTGTSSRPFQ